MAPHSLGARIRGEYLEMPGLRLTLAQACRLWQIDTATCHEILSDLVTDHFLHRTVDGFYVAFPSRPTPVKASLSSARPVEVRRRRRADG